MSAFFVRFGSRTAIPIALFFVACASAPMLVSKNPTVPEGVDLSGQWIVRGDSDLGRSQMDGSQERLVVSSRSQRSQRSRRQRSSSGVSAQVFLEYGESLKITQTNFGIFISYDRAIVEEFTFGENRVVSVGPIEARRVSGWEGHSFVVETLDESGTTLFETWHLESDNTLLIRDIRMSKGDEENFRLRQLFDRT
jgi:hypothetical protein